MSELQINKRYITDTRQFPHHTVYAKVWRTLSAIFLVPISLIFAALLGGKGVWVQVKISLYALGLIVKRKPISPHLVYSMLLFPMFSTRYFELDFVNRRTANKTFYNYLDISSPRFLPFIIAKSNDRLVKMDLLNPDKSDLDETCNLMGTFELLSKCTLQSKTIETAELCEASYDLITCVSVLEHIPDFQAALHKIWRLLKPSGTLLLTLPCESLRQAEYIKGDLYGLLPVDNSGFVFMQYVFDEELLSDCVFPITGCPSYLEIYGERTPGFLRQSLIENVPGSDYSFWFESLRMAAKCRKFEAIRALPGEGVICMEFVK